MEEIKSALEQNHSRIVEQYKNKMTETFMKMKEQLQHARNENHGLNNKIMTIETKLEELSIEKVCFTQNNILNALNARRKIVRLYILFSVVVDRSARGKCKNERERIDGQA